jgi:hypothetical protein
MDTSYSGTYSQIGAASVGPSSLNFLDLSNSNLARPSISGTNNQLEMERFTPTPVSAQSFVQSGLEGLSVIQYSNLTQPISASSPLYQAQSSQNTGKGKTTRKRPRSPKPTRAHQLSVIRRQLSTRTGVPMVSLGAFCLNPGPAPKRSRTSLQKQNKKDVESAGGSCFLCLARKRRVFPSEILNHFLRVQY